jgi:hypothetical protein
LLDGSPSFCAQNQNVTHLSHERKDREDQLKQKKQRLGDLLGELVPTCRATGAGFRV